MPTALLLKDTSTHSLPLGLLYEDLCHWVKVVALVAVVNGRVNGHVLRPCPFDLVLQRCGEVE
jgi:hypothetical protein